MSGDIKPTPASYPPSTQSLFLPTTREYTVSIVLMSIKQWDGEPWAVLQKELINTTVCDEQPYHLGCWAAQELALSWTNVPAEL